MFGAIITSTPDFQTSESENRKSFFRRGVAIFCALAITTALLMGYSYLRWRHAQRLRADEAAQIPTEKPSPSPVVQVFVDEAMIKGSQVLIGGTVQNTSTSNLTNLTVELELKRRSDGKSEMRTVVVTPGELKPSQLGRYALSVASREFRESTLKSIKSGQTSTDLPFKLMPGAVRPDERLKTKEIIIIKPTQKRGTGEEFINTPETPVKVP